MLFKNINFIDENLTYREDTWIRVEDKKITYIGKEVEAKEGERVYEGQKKMIIPGLYNAHAHSPMTLLRGYGENMRLMDWLEKRIFPFESKLTGEAVYWGTILAMGESMKNGIVSTTDMYFFCNQMGKAILESGMKNNLSRGITNFTKEDIMIQESGLEMKETFETYHGAGEGRILVDLCIHGEYTSNPETVEKVADYAKKVNGNMHIHMSETKGEHEGCKEKYGMTPAKYFLKHGVFDQPTTAAHCVWIEGEDYNILREKGVTVAVNPISNMKLASGICDVSALQRAGINIAIGTDGVASNNSLNFLEEMKMFALASKVKTGDPTVVTPEDTIKAATIGGAKSQGRKSCGKIKEGYCGDLVVLDIDKPEYFPKTNMLNNLIYSSNSGDVVLTMVDGKVLYEKGEYLSLDMEKAKYEVERITKEIIKSC